MLLLPAIAMSLEISMGAEIKPYRISIGDDALDDLRSRLRNTRWPEAELVDDWSQGAPLLWISDLPLSISSRWS